MEANQLIIHGPVPLQPIPTETVGELVYNSLKENINKKHEALVSSFVNCNFQSENFSTLMQ